MWYSSAGFIQQAPLLGHGMGAYPVVSEAHFQDPKMCLHGCRHPHNQYVFYAVEFGLIGLALLMFVLYQSFLRHRPMSPESTMPVVGLWLFALSRLVETTLWYRGFFYLFVPLLALSMLGPNKPPVERMGEAR
jgi:O-antigen ligase